MSTSLAGPIKAIAVQGDITDMAACERMVATTNDTLCSIGILINNAGLSSVSEKQPFITEMQDDQLQRLLNAHVFGSLHMCRLVVPQMRELGRGDVIMISSVATAGYAPKMGVYGIAKAGMEAMAYTLAKEERKNGIRVNVVAPGLVDTDMDRRLMNFTRGIEDIRTMDENSPFGFVCQPEDVSNAVAFLCSEESRYITNQRLTVNGGGF